VGVQIGQPVLGDSRHRVDRSLDVAVVLQ
jgi:hypothetical protein